MATRQEKSAPLLPNPQDRLDPLGTGRMPPASAEVVPSSRLHFDVKPDLPELVRFAGERGWLTRGFTQLSVAWLEVRFTTDGWKTTRLLSSADVPSPVVGAHIHLPRVPPHTEVEFALLVGLTCRAPQDTAGARDAGSVWLNNDGKNYRQTTR